MAKSNYWRGGKHVVNVSPREWRVGNVPPASGFYPNGREVDLNKINLPTYQAVLSMIAAARKKGVNKVVVGVYHPGESKGEKFFRWTRQARRSLAEFEMQVRAAVARGQNINEFAMAILNLNVPAGTAIAWALVGVK